MSVPILHDAFTTTVIVMSPEVKTDRSNLGSALAELVKDSLDTWCGWIAALRCAPLFPANPRGLCGWRDFQQLGGSPR